jgi:hypothetical protein
MCLSALQSPRYGLGTYYVGWSMPGGMSRQTSKLFLPDRQEDDLETDDLEKAQNGEGEGQVGCMVAWLRSEMAGRCPDG